MLQQRPTFRDLQSPQTERRRRFSETHLRNQQSRTLVAPVNKRVEHWHKQVVFLRARVAKSGFCPHTEAEAASLNAEVFEALVALELTLDVAPECRANSRVIDTDRALRSILKTLETL